MKVNDARSYTCVSEGHERSPTGNSAAVSPWWARSAETQASGNSICLAINSASRSKSGSSLES